MAAEVQSVEAFKGQPRLPLFAAPRKYEVSLKPELVACKFSGSARIAIDVVSPTGFLVLNAADLVVDPAIKIIDLSGSSSTAAEVVLVPEDEILVIKVGKTLPVGEHVVEINFQGTLNDQMKGFYRSVYELKGEEKNMAVTQFEPADARRCFPCWDEPSFKAKFKITLEVPLEVAALSNMPVMEERIVGPVKTVSFEESPIMSTYLVAMVVGIFDYVEDITHDGIKVRVYCQVGRSSEGKFALDVAVKTLGLYEKYFGLPYPLPKLDMVAIPDFSAGAMENYGLVTYRETALLYDEQRSAASDKQRVTIVVAHELAHQWFGNLVTMEWWTHLWLNEGFATWVSYLSADSLFPQWNIWTQFLDESTDGLGLDSLAGSHPIEVDINHAQEIDEIFDAISYKKGASIIRMLQAYLGADCFQKALAAYIKKFAYSNAKTEDLWDVLEQQSSQPVRKLMNSWTKQKGYPVIHVKIKDGKLELEQAQFLLNGAAGVGQWIVPVTLCIGSYDTQKKFLLEAKQDSFDLANLLGGGAGSLWLKLNVEQAGFYRVSYDDELRASLRSAIKAGELHAADRFGVLEDCLALCIACKQDLASLLSLLAAFKDETEYSVVSLILTASVRVMSVITIAAPELADAVKSFLIGLLLSYFKKLGWDSKSGQRHLDAMLRGEVLSCLVELKHGATIDEAVRRFKIFLQDRDTLILPPDIRKAAYLGVMQKVTVSDQEGFESLLKIYRESELSQEKIRVLAALAACPDPAIVVKALNFVKSPLVRNQDGVILLRGISQEGQGVALEWLKENWDYISSTWSGFLISRFISLIVSPLSSEEKAAEVEEFFASRTKPSFARTLQQSLEQVRIKSRWIESVKTESPSLRDVLGELSRGF